MFQADLHCHTSCSDGTFSPIDLVALAKEIGLSGLSITDHDTIEAYETAITAAREKGILLGSGIEFSCSLDGFSIHLLGYDYSLDHSEIKTLCQRHQERREKRNRSILSKLARLNMSIKESELDDIKIPHKTIGRPHIAMIMVQKGYVSTLREAFNSFLGEGKCCYDPGEPFAIEETIEVIHNAGGKAFIAHPHFIDRSKIIKKLLLMPFDGIECHYAKLPKDQEKKWIKIAKEKQWLISGGSDFHGTIKPHIPLGASWTDEETFHKIFQKLL